ncbi:hypothetical protein IIA16_05180 [bacterium]|nr:hypothetical protein [bacterium]
MKEAPPPPGPPEERPPGWNPFKNEPDAPLPPPLPPGASQEDMDMLEARLADAEWKLEEQDRDISRLESRRTARRGCGCWGCVTTLLVVYLAIWLLRTFFGLDLIGMMAGGA